MRENVDLLRSVYEPCSITDNQSATKIKTLYKKQNNNSGANPNENLVVNNIKKLIKLHLF
jgi:hypothetical protein